MNTATPTAPRVGSHFLPGEIDELIDSAMAGNAVKERDELVARLERQLATECSVERIACAGTFAGIDIGQEWFASPSHFQHEDVHTEYALALRYLDLRGLVERHPEHHDWVLILEEKS
jgi:hypothetical protein